MCWVSGSRSRLWHWCFTVSFAKFLRAPFFTEHLRWLLLWFILVASIVVTWVSWFNGHKFKLEAVDFIFHILQRNFPNFVVKILALCSPKVFEVFIFPYFVLIWYILVQSMELFKVWLKLSENGYFSSFSIQKWQIIVQTNRQNKTSIQIFRIFLTNKAPLVLIFFQGLHITCKTYYNLSIKGENYQLN